MFSHNLAKSREIIINNMAAEADSVIFECPLLKLRGTRKRAVKFGSTNTWQQKYFMLKRDGDMPYLLYYNKKPKHNKVIPRGKILLHSSFRVEKSMNAKNRAYVFEITTPDRQLCLSADEQKVMDLFVFFLQIQLKLSDDIIDDYFIVQPENSEAFRRIGARGTHCMFHIAPWGVTLALLDSRLVLAQWPLKCIRCYESNSNNQFILEAGRIAPMGDGVYVFNTRSNEDITMYDLLDKYVLNATAALQGRHPNNQEQYSDLLLERDRLNALTTISPGTSLQNTELHQATVQNYNYTVQGFTETTLPQNHTPDLVRAPPGVEQQQSGTYLTPQSSLRQPPSQAQGRLQPSQLKGRPPPIALTNEMFGIQSKLDPNRNNLNYKPPSTVELPEPIRSSISKSAITKNSSFDNTVASSVGLDSQDGYLDMRQSIESLDVVLSRTVSIPPMSPANTDWAPPPSFSEATRVSAGSYTGLKVNISPSKSIPGTKNMQSPQRQFSHMSSGSLLQLSGSSASPSIIGSPGSHGSSLSFVHDGPVLPPADSSYLNPRASEPDPMSKPAKTKPPVAPRGKTKGAESPVTMPRPKYRMMRLKSHSFEEITNFKQTAYANMEYEADGFSGTDYVNTSVSKRTPEPFSGLDLFENKGHSEDKVVRRFVKHEKSHSGLSDTSNSPQHRHQRQQNLRRSVSNPNFFDLETKDIITKRDKMYKTLGHGGTSLGKSPARSLASLLPGALKRHLSREINDDWNSSLVDNPGAGRSRSASNSFRGRSGSMTKSSPDLLSSNFSRQYRRSSFGSKDSISASTKGIRMSEKSRSFRKLKAPNDKDNLSRQASQASGAESTSPTGTDSNAGTPAINKVLSPFLNGLSSPETPAFGFNSLPLRRKGASIMAGRRLPSLPDEKKRESAC